MENSVQRPGCPSATGQLSTANFKALGSSQRGKCVLKNNKNKDLLKRLRAGGPSEGARGW